MAAIEFHAGMRVVVKFRAAEAWQDRRLVDPVTKTDFEEVMGPVDAPVDEHKPLVMPHSGTRRVPALVKLRFGDRGGEKSKSSLRPALGPFSKQFRPPRGLVTKGIPANRGK
jgi:hypothetical protein